MSLRGHWEHFNKVYFQKCPSSQSIMDCFIGPMQETYFQQLSPQLKNSCKRTVEVFQMGLKFKDLFSSLSIVALDVSKVQKLCSRQPLPAVEWSCNTFLIIWIETKFNMIYSKSCIRGKVENVSRYSNYSAYHSLGMF